MPTITGSRKSFHFSVQHSAHITTGDSFHPPSQNMRVIGKRSREGSLLRMDLLQLKSARLWRQSLQRRQARLHFPMCQLLNRSMMAQPRRNKRQTMRRRCRMDTNLDLRWSLGVLDSVANMGISSGCLHGFSAIND
jgi:hypothetical protein